MRTWVYIHLLVEHPKIVAAAIILVVIGFVLDVWLKNKKLEKAGKPRNKPKIKGW